jgi:hypothetical protein
MDFEACYGAAALSRPFLEWRIPAKANQCSGNNYFD